MAKLANSLKLTTLFLSSSLALSVHAEDAKPQSLPKKNFTVCGGKMSLEMADTPEARSIGLMHRNEVKAGTGMLFVFPNEQILGFWMRNVSFDIDIGYFGKKGELLKSYTMKGTSPMMRDDALPQYSSEKLALFAVEAPAGFFAGAKIKNCHLSPLPKKSSI